VTSETGGLACDNKLLLLDEPCEGLAPVIDLENEPLHHDHLAIKRRDYAPGSRVGTARLACKPQDGPCLGRAGHWSVMTVTEVGNAPHQSGIGWGQLVPTHPDVVLKAGTRMATGRDAPFIHLDLMTANPAGAPFATWKKPFNSPDIIVEYIPVSRTEQCMPPCADQDRASYRESHTKPAPSSQNSI
jgi:hypothetical protein